MNAENDSKKWSNIIFLTLPIWLTVVWNLAFWVELKFTRHGPFNELAIYAIFLVPAIGGFPILTSKVPFFAKLFVFPIYYLGGLLAAGVVGWSLCADLHTCH
jgi:hypothetical protein